MMRCFSVFIVSQISSPSGSTRGGACSVTCPVSFNSPLMVAFKKVMRRYLVFRFILFYLGQFDMTLFYFILIYFILCVMIEIEYDDVRRKENRCLQTVILFRCSTDTTPS